MRKMRGRGDAGTQRKTNAQCPMPHAPCPMPNAQCPMPHAQCPMPNALCPIPLYKIDCRLRRL